MTQKNLDVTARELRLSTHGRPVECHKRKKTHV